MRVSSSAHLLPVRDPARQAADREHHREHVRRDADGAVDDAAVEVDVRVELALDEVLVRQSATSSSALAMSSSGSLTPSLVEHLVGGLLEDRGARVEVLVDAVAEAHQPEAGALVLGLVDELLVVAAVGLDASRASRSPPGWRRRAAAPTARRCRRAIEAYRLAWLLPTMRTVEVEQFCSWSACRISSRSSASPRTGVDLVVLGRHREHHVQEVRRVAKVVARVDERLADRLLVASRRRSSAPWRCSRTMLMLDVLGDAGVRVVSAESDVTIADRIAIGWALARERLEEAASCPRGAGV